MGLGLADRWDGVLLIDVSPGQVKRKTIAVSPL